MTGSMLRPTVSEIYSLKFEDINVKEIKNGKGKVKYLEFAINRKNRPAVVQTLPTSFYAYEDIVERRPNHKPTDYLFAPQYENRRTAMRYISNMFKQLLIELKMQKGKLGEERSLYSLRHSSLNQRLESGVSMEFVAYKGNTSPEMMKNYYIDGRNKKQMVNDHIKLFPDYYGKK